MVRVLIVDDVLILRIGLASLLSLEPDLEICGSAGSGEQGIEVARETCPDVVLMDIRMPGMDGVEATRQIRHDLPATQVVVLTGEPSLQGRQAALEAGAAAYVVKDAAPATVLEAVRSAWSARPPGYAV
ncbi:response regulator receiver domain-containing protein [Humibacillus xanthopallidus]|uniref:Response regulator receiver domain-containing protein n=1 Tax=Humibacillus xanthopallidus TaxID=412689 RepID=A0A543PLX9_9MICO|nr:response regulator transcription factor [Humibacillus xanthopallidus]TQN45080.1 response regulator receiver domain-containing protein [Humibacillus xanthopallidus]